MGSGPLAGLHVVLVPTWYPTPEAPTGGRLFKEYLEAFSGAGARVGLLYPDLVDLGNWRHNATRRGYLSRVLDMGLPPWPWPVLREESEAGAPVVRVRGLHTSAGKRERRILGHVSGKLVERHGPAGGNGGVFRNDDLMGAIEIDEFLDLRHPMLH